MKNHSLRLITSLGAVTIIGIFIVQLYWLRKAFDVQEMQFNQTVHVALSNVSEQLQENNPTVKYPVQSVEQLSSNYFVLNINGKIDTSLLSNNIQKEFSLRNIKTDVEYGIYDSVSHKMLFGKLINTHSTKGAVDKRRALPVIMKGQYYLGILLPGKSFHIIGEMYVWIFSTLLLFVFILIFCYALFMILQQKRLSEVQKDFVNNMTHEFRTPISTIALSAATIANHSLVNQDKDLRTFTNIISRESERLNHNIEKILQMAQSDSRKLKLSKEKIDLHNFISETIHNASLYFNKDIKIESCLEAIHSVIYADKLHMHNIILNLLDNAFKYSEEGSVVQIKTFNRDHHLILTVEDSGIGIHKAYQNKIFNKFFRVPTGNIHNTKGFGIGLNYVKNIVKAHQWKINFRSIENYGTVFSVYIPA